MSVRSAQLLSQYRSGDWISAEDFGRLCTEASDHRLERTAEGTLIVMSPAGGGTGRRNSKLSVALGYWAERDGRGETFDSSTGFTLPNGAVRSPDASWLEKARWHALTPVQQEDFPPICPDFVVELRSKLDRIKGLRAKMKEYLEQGARLGWLIDPLTQTVEIYRAGKSVETLKQPAELDGEDVLPGFVLELKGILFD